MSKLEQAMKDIKNVFGSDKVGSFSEVSKTEGSFTTGSLQADACLKGGFPRGKISEIYGPEGSGKTTCTLHAIADAQAQGLNALFIDLEGTFDKEYAEALGVNTEPPALIYTSPDKGEDALSIAERLIRTGEIGIAVLDSVATLLPGKEQDGEYGDATMGVQARLMSQACRKLNPVIKMNNTAFIFINQLREKIGGYGNPETTTGGNSLKFYATVRLDIRRDGTPIKDKEAQVIGEPRKMKIVKSKISPYTNSVVHFDIYYGEGIDQYGEILDMAVNNDLIKKSGAWYSYNDTKIGQGRESAKQFLRDNPELAEELKQAILSMFNPATEHSEDNT